MIKFKIIQNEIKIETKRNYKKISKLNKDYFFIYKKGRETLNNKIFFNLENINSEITKEFFINNDFLDTFIIKEKNKLFIGISIDGKNLNIFENGEITYFSTEEFLFKKKINLNAVILSLATRHSYWLPKNINNNNKILPGTLNEIDIKENRKINIVKSRLIFNFNEFGTNKDHNSILNNLNIEFDKVFNDYKNINGEWHMMLSAGLDSSLNLAFAHRNKLNVKLNTFSSDTLEDEAIGARRFAKFFKLPFRNLNKGYPGNKKKELTTEDDITDYLNHLKPLLENTYNNLIFVNNYYTYLSYLSEGKTMNYIDGSSYPAALSLQENSNYPYYIGSGFEKPNFNKYSEIRRQFLNPDFRSTFSYDANLKYFMSNINPKYSNIFMKLFSGAPKMQNDSYFLLKKGFNNTELINNALNERARDMYNYMETFGILNELNDYSDKKYLSLQKTFILLNHLIKNSIKLVEISENLNINAFRPGSNTSIINILLNCSYDDLLINENRWHFFQLFKQACGEDFFKINYKSLIFAELRQKMKFKINQIRKKEKINKIFFKNKSFQSFIISNYGLELNFLIEYFKVTDNCKNFLDSKKFHFQFKNKMINMAALLKNNKVSF